MSVPDSLGQVLAPTRSPSMIQLWRCRTYTPAVCCTVVPFQHVVMLRQALPVYCYASSTAITVTLRGLITVWMFVLAAPPQQLPRFFASQEEEESQLVVACQRIMVSKTCCVACHRPILGSRLAVGNVGYLHAPLICTIHGA